MEIITVRDLLKTDVDIDIGNDWIDMMLPAYCGPVELTAKGEEKFADVLSFELEYEPEHAFGCLLLRKEGGTPAWLGASVFFKKLAGWCSEEEWDSLFMVPTDEP